MAEPKTWSKITTVTRYVDIAVSFPKSTKSSENTAKYAQYLTELRNIENDKHKPRQIKKCVG